MHRRERSRRHQPNPLSPSPMFKITKFDPKAPSIFESLEKAGWKAPQETVEYLKEVSQKGLFSLHFTDPANFDATSLTTFTEADAVVSHEDIQDYGLLGVSSDIFGSKWNDTITINQVGEYRGHANVNYHMHIYGREGNDTITNLHVNLGGSQDRQLLSAYTYGGEGYDQFVSLGHSSMVVQDIEHTETFTVDASYQFAERRENFYNQMFISSDFRQGHMVELAEGDGLMRLLNDQGNNVFVCMPEL